MAKRSGVFAALMFLCILVFGGISTSALTIVPSDADEFDGHYYKIYTDLEELRDERYALAKKLCEKRGGHLAVPESEEESVFLGSMLHRGGQARAFIGLKYKDGGWVRADGGDITFTYWADGAEELLGDGDCALIENGDSGRWHSAVFGKGYSAYICEWDKGRPCGEYDIGYAKDFVPEKTVRYETSRYKLFNNVLPRNDAQNFCRSMGGHLVSITDKEEQSFLEGLISSEGKRGAYWIGAYYINESDSWCWLSSERFTYSNWSKGQPRFHSFDVQYALMNADLDRYGFGQWAAERSEGRTDKQDEYYTNIGFICEWDLVCGDSFYHGHTKQVQVEAPTCISSGAVKTVCEDCGEQISFVTLPQTSHRYVETALFLGIRIPGITAEWCVSCGDRQYYSEPEKLWFAPVLVILVGTMTASFLSVWISDCRTHRKKGEKISAPPIWMLLMGYFFIAVIMFVLYHIFIV